MTKNLYKLMVPALCVLSAQAATILTLSDGKNSVSVNQNGIVTAVGSASGTGTGSGDHGTVTFVGNVGNFNFNVNTGRGGNAVTLPALLSLNSVDVLSTGTGVLTLTFSDDGYSDLAPVLELSSSITFAANTANGTTAEFDAFADLGNGIPATTLIGTMGPFEQFSSPNTISIASLQLVPNLIGANGSLTESVKLTFAGASEIDSSFTISNSTLALAPEPGSIGLLACSMAFLALAVRKKLE